MASVTKDQISIDIKSPLSSAALAPLPPPPPPPPPSPPPPQLEEHKNMEQQQPGFWVDLTAEELPKEQSERVPFPLFRRIRQGRENTWVISLIVILHFIVFVATISVNNCRHVSHHQCAFQFLGRFSFQPLSENPFLGPSASTLNKMGALQETLITELHQLWRLFTSPWLHAGVFHLIVNLFSVIYVGVHLVQEFGPVRVGSIYLISGVTGSLLGALFIQHRPSVTSSGALFGLLGMMLSGLMRNWKVYTKKLAALLALSVIISINLLLGLIPYVDNFANFGGFLSGFLVGFVLLFKPLVGKAAHNKAGLFEFDVKQAVRVRNKLDKPLLRIISLVFFSILVAGLTIGVLHGMDANQYCRPCQYLDCVPSKWWSCSNRPMHCEMQSIVSTEQLTITCSRNGNFRIFPSIEFSEERLQDLCYLICS